MSVRERIRAEVKRGLPSEEPPSGEPAVDVERDWRLKEGSVRYRDLLRAGIRGRIGVSLIYLSLSVFAAVDAVRQAAVGYAAIAILGAAVGLYGLRVMDYRLREESTPPGVVAESVDDRYGGEP